MASNIKLKTASGGSVALQVDDTLTTDEEVEAGLYKSPDGSLWKITVNDTGNITMVKVQ